MTTTEIPSRRWSGEWGAASAPHEVVDVDVLIPTVGRVAELAVTLAGLAAQEEPRFRVVIGDQSPDEPVVSHPSVRSMMRVLEGPRRVRDTPHRATWSRRAAAVPARAVERPVRTLPRR